MINRYKWKNTEKSATRDRVTLADWADGKIKWEVAAWNLEESNDWEHGSINEIDICHIAVWLGYHVNHKIAKRKAYQSVVLCKDMTVHETIRQKKIDNNGTSIVMHDCYRIKFKNSETACEADKDTIAKYANGEVSGRVACREIERHNGLRKNSMNIETLTANVLWLGYWRDLTNAKKQKGIVCCSEHETDIYSQMVGIQVTPNQALNCYGLSDSYGVCTPED